MNAYEPYRPFAVFAKSALVADARHRFTNIVVEKDHGIVVLKGELSDARLAREAGELAAAASGTPVFNRIVVRP